MHLFVFGYEVGFNTTSKHIKVVPYKKITDNGSQNMEKILRHGFRWLEKCMKWQVWCEFDGDHTQYHFIVKHWSKIEIKCFLYLPAWKFVRKQWNEFKCVFRRIWYHPINSQYTNFNIHLSFIQNTNLYIDSEYGKYINIFFLFHSTL